APGRRKVGGRAFFFAPCAASSQSPGLVEACSPYYNPTSYRGLATPPGKLSPHPPGCAIADCPRSNAIRRAGLPESAVVDGPNIVDRRLDLRTTGHCPSAH